MLKNVSFTVPRDSMTALVGPSGSGKSTIANLLPRFRDTQKCEVLLRGADDPSLHIRRGESVVLAGDSGCGKTTVTRLINGLIPHYYEGELSGFVTVCGLDAAASCIGDLAPHVGSVFQNPRSQFFNVDTTSELTFASENLCRSPEEIRESIRRVAAEMRMENLMDRSIFALSGG